MCSHSDVQVESEQTAETSSGVPERGSTYRSAPAHAWPLRKGLEAPGGGGLERSRNPALGCGARPGEVMRPLGWLLENLGRLMKGSGLGPEVQGLGLGLQDCTPPGPARGVPQGSPETAGAWALGGVDENLYRVLSCWLAWTLLPPTDGRRLEVPAEALSGTSLTGPSVAARWQCSCGLCQLVLRPCHLAHRPPSHSSLCPRSGPTQGGVPEGRPVYSPKAPPGAQDPHSPLRLKLPPLRLSPGGPPSGGPPHPWEDEACPRRLHGLLSVVTPLTLALPGK